MPSPSETLEIENVVASTGIEQELDLDQLEEDLAGTDYNPDKSPALIYRIQSPKASVLIFRSGKMICAGAASVDKANQAIHVVFDELRSLGIDVRIDAEIVIQNLVASGDLGQRLNLLAIAIGLGLEDVEYEPEQFPGLVYRIPDTTVVGLLFGSGNVVITGCESFEDATKAIKTIHNHLQNLDLLD